MRNWQLLCVAMAVATMVCPAVVQASNVTLLYGMEGADDGFGTNGGGIYTQDTIGTTEGLNSLKAAVQAPFTFVGALTTDVPAALGDPPGISYILLDMTVVDPVFAGASASVGVTVFGATQPGVGQLFGLPFQFADTELISGKAAGLYKDVRIDLDNSLNAHPFTAQAGLTFNQLFGPNPGAPNDIIPTGFQLTIQKSAGAALTVYFDNIRAVVPEPATFGLLGMGAVVLGAIGRRRRAS